MYVAGRKEGTLLLAREDHNVDGRIFYVYIIQQGSTLCKGRWHNSIPGQIKKCCFFFAIQTVMGSLSGLVFCLQQWSPLDASECDAHAGFLSNRNK